MEFEQLLLSDANKIKEMSEMATEIVREHFDSIIGKHQNDYMIEKFQTVAAIRSQLEQGSQYYFVIKNGRRIGFLAYYPKALCMYLSKIYLYKEERGKGNFRKMLDFIIRKAQEKKLPCIELNVNKNNNAALAYEKLGFKIIRSEKIDIGGGFYMDDYVYRLEI